MYYRGTSLGEDGCGFTSCSQAITSVGNPLIWWAATAALFYLVYRLARYREWRVGLILMGIVAGYVPWLMYLGRTVFQFYTIAFEPYLLLGLTFVIGLILGPSVLAGVPTRRRRTVSPVSSPGSAGSSVGTMEGRAEVSAGPAEVLEAPGDSLASPEEAIESPTDDPVRRTSGIRVVVIFLVFAALVSAFFFPLWTGIQTPFLFWQLHTWLPSWR